MSLRSESRKIDSFFTGVRSGHNLRLARGVLAVVPVPLMRAGGAGSQVGDMRGAVGAAHVRLECDIVRIVVALARGATDARVGPVAVSARRSLAVVTGLGKGAGGRSGVRMAQASVLQCNFRPVFQ